MGLRSADGLRAFCEDLGSALPSPGGGTAAAAAGAMAASLLSMVCGITLKSRKHEGNWPRLGALQSEAVSLTSELLRLAEDDALAYDRVVDASRAKRLAPEDGTAQTEYESAVRNATEVPMATADACVRVLRLSSEVARLGTRSAASDVEVARRLAGAGVDGAVANIRINLPYCVDTGFAADAVEAAGRLVAEKDGLLAP